MGLCGGILIVNEKGEPLYRDERADRILREASRWPVACPPPREGQWGEVWDLPVGEGRTHMVTSSTFVEDGETIQVHHITDSSVYMELKRSLFQNQDSIAVFNMDVNNLKQMNDTHGHKAGDRLIQKAAESLRRIEARNVLAFRVGGDEFLVAALHLSRAEAEALHRKWADGLAELNRRNDGVECVVACGMAYGEKGYDLDAVLAEADRRMYEDKKARKLGRVREA